MHPTKEQILFAITQTEQLVPAPRTLSRALQLLRDPQSDIADIATLISRDSALSVDMLRCANSAYYALSSPVTSIAQAVQIVGARDALRILNIVATYQMAHRSLGSYGIAAADYCTESLFSGFYLERLAMHTRGGDPGEAYTAGLLRLVGRLAVNQAALQVGGIPVWDGRTPLAQWEREHVGITQFEAGAILLSKWGFPETMVTAVQRQDEVLGGVDSGWLTLALNFANHSIPPGIGADFGGPGEPVSFDFAAEHPFVQSSGLTPETAAQVSAEAQQALREAQEQFGR